MSAFRYPLVLGLMLALAFASFGTARAANEVSDAAQLCMGDGYLEYERADGSAFANVGECIQYVAQGSPLEPISTATVTITSVVIGGELTFSVSFIASGFTPNSLIMEYIHSNPEAGIYTDFGYTATGSMKRFNADGELISGTGSNDPGACVDGSVGSITLTDETGITATGYYTLDCV